MFNKGMTTNYDAWLERGSDYGADDFALWAESDSATEAYSVYVARAKDDDEPYSFEDWLETDEANTAYDDARYNEDDYPDHDDEREYDDYDEREVQGDEHLSADYDERNGDI